MDPEIPFGEECTMCGGPDTGVGEIDVGDGEPDDEGVIRWAHAECVDEWDQMFLEAYRETDGFDDFFNGGDAE